MAQFEYQPGSNDLRSCNSYESAARKFVALVISENDETFLMNRGKVRKLHRFNKDAAIFSSRPSCRFMSRFFEDGTS